MHVVAGPPFRTGSILWQEAPEQWTLTVVCKATYALAPVTSPIADEQDEVNERDNHWDDDPQRSLYLPSDLAPMKPEPEVILVGSAFAPRTEPVRSLFARIIVGQLDKSIEVHCPRTWMSDGTLHEGPPWTQMPLRYERAAGGEGTWNPVGLPPDMVDRYGRRALPNLQPPGVSLGQPSDVAAPIGFGPIAPSWPRRRDKIVDRPPWTPDLAAGEPLGEGFDASFFQAAPEDQRVAELRPDEQLILENLHPEHARLVTRLPGIRPRARVECEDMPPWDLLLVADTLWIDTLRAVCTLVWRAQVPLSERDQAGLVRIGVEEPGLPVRWPSSDAPPSSKMAEPRPTHDTLQNDFAHTETDDAAIRALPGLPKPVLPFHRAGAPKPSATLVSGAAPRKAAIITPKQKLPELWAPDAPTETMKNLTAQPRGATPMWLDLNASPTSSVAAPPPPRPPPIPPMLRPAEPIVRPAEPIMRPAEPPMLRPAEPMISVRPVEPPMLRPPEPVSMAPSIPQPSARIPPPPSSYSGITPSELPVVPRPDERALAGAAYVGVLEASNAAAEPRPQRPVRAALPSEPAIPPVSVPHTLVELVWHDPTKVARLRQDKGFQPLLRPQPAAPPPPPADDPEAAARAAEAKARAERADVAAVIARGTAVTDVEGAIVDAATEDGDVEPPLVVVAGDIELGLDEVKMLEAMLGAAAAFASGDKKLKEVIDLASEVARTPLGASPGVAAGLVGRVREAWVKANRLLPADWLDVHTRRLLLEQRSYQKRELWSDTYIRALIAPSSDAPGIPAYLPAPLGKQLPLFARFPVRVIAEAFPQQDQLETHPVALRVAALGRVMPGRVKHR